MIREQILKLKSENPTWSYNKIGRELGFKKDKVAYYLNPEKRKQKFKNNTFNKQRRMLELKTKFGGKCCRCGYCKSFRALQFHHINNFEKIEDISTLLHNKSYASAKEEAKKCILVCANCHAELHDELLVVPVVVATTLSSS